MLTSKQRATLKAMANGLDTILYIGKSGVTDNVVTQTDEALLARELIKGSVQQNAPLSAKEALEALVEATGAEPVSSGGRKFVLYTRTARRPLNQNLNMAVKKLLSLSDDPTVLNVWAASRRLCARRWLITDSTVLS